MKWILVALSGLALVALGAGAIEGRLAAAREPTTFVQARQVSVEPAKAGLQPIPGAQPGGLETAPQAPETAPAAPGPMTVGPAVVVVEPRCGAVSAGRKPAPLCPPG